MSENTTPEAPEADETLTADRDTADTAPDATEAEPEANPAESPEETTFSRDYVEKLRKESAGYRDRAKTAETRAETLARQLFTAKVAATGKLADPTDLEFNPDLLDDTDRMAEAIDNLLAAKPHLKSRKPSGDVGQGNRGKSEEPFSLLKALQGS